MKRYKEWFKHYKNIMNFKIFTVLITAEPELEKWWKRRIQIDSENYLIGDS